MHFEENTSEAGRCEHAGVCLHPSLGLSTAPCSSDCWAGSRAVVPAVPAAALIPREPMDASLLLLLLLYRQKHWEEHKHGYVLAEQISPLRQKCEPAQTGSQAPPLPLCLSF